MFKDANYGVPAKLVYNGIHPDLIKKKEKDWMPGNILNIIEVGRLDVEKGQQVVIEALRILKEWNVKGITMTFIGDGANRPILENMVKEYGLSGIVSFWVCVTGYIYILIFVIMTCLFSLLYQKALD